MHVIETMITDKIPHKLDKACHLFPLDRVTIRIKKASIPTDMPSNLEKLLKEHINCYNIMYAVVTRHPKGEMGWKGYTTGIMPTDST